MKQRIDPMATRTWVYHYNTEPKTIGRHPFEYEMASAKAHLRAVALRVVALLLGIVVGLIGAMYLLGAAMRMIAAFGR